jgi:hypothetical protein
LQFLFFVGFCHGGARGLLNARKSVTMFV